MRTDVVDFAVGGEPAVEGSTVPGGHADRGVRGHLGRHVGVSSDMVDVADEVLPAPLGDRLTVGDHFRARVAVFLLREMLLAVGVVLNGLGGASGKGEGEGDADWPEFLRVWPRRRACQDAIRSSLCLLARIARLRAELIWRSVLGRNFTNSVTLLGTLDPAWLRYR